MLSDIKKNEPSVPGIKPHVQKFMSHTLTAKMLRSMRIKNGVYP
jgi:hypothetical protein